MKKILAVVVAVAMLASMSTVAMANPGTGTVAFILDGINEIPSRGIFDPNPDNKDNDVATNGADDAFCTATCHEDWCPTHAAHIADPVENPACTDCCDDTDCNDWHGPIMRPFMALGGTNIDFGVWQRPLVAGVHYWESARGLNDDRGTVDERTQANRVLDMGIQNYMSSAPPHTPPAFIPNGPTASWNLTVVRNGFTAGGLQHLQSASIALDWDDGPLVTFPSGTVVEDRVTINSVGDNTPGTGLLAGSAGANGPSVTMATGDGYGIFGWEWEAILVVDYAAGVSFPPAGVEASTTFTWTYTVL